MIAAAINPDCVEEGARPAACGAQLPLDDASVAAASWGSADSLEWTARDAGWREPETWEHPTSRALSEDKRTQLNHAEGRGLAHSRALFFRG